MDILEENLSQGKKTWMKYTNYQILWECMGFTLGLLNSKENQTSLKFYDLY
jgi:hypothetical protein